MKIQRKVILFLIVIFLSITADAQPALSDTAMEISLPSVNGEIIKLSSLKGKVVLLDFWASWCGPCRLSNKRLVKLYSKYKEKGFEILGVSFDNNINDWKKAIKKDKITWLQVVDKRGFDASTASQWNISAIPTSFLLDKDGVIVRIDPEGEHLEESIRKFLLKE